MLLFSSPLHSLRKTKAFRALLKSCFNNPRLRNLGFDHKVAVRPLTHASISWRRSKIEPGIKELITKVCSKLKYSETDYFLDVGANIGLYTWEVAKISPKQKIMSFEPDPKNFELLEMTHQASGPNNIELYEIALSNESKKTDFHQDSITSATGSISLGKNTWIEEYLNVSAQKIMVTTKTMDQVLGETKIPTLVKIDVEGHENEVIHGGMKNITKHKPLLIIESFPPQQEKIIEILSNLGYRLYDADRMSNLQNKTTNLFAWHSEGPLGAFKIESFLTL